MIPFLSNREQPVIALSAANLSACTFYYVPVPASKIVNVWSSPVSLNGVTFARLQLARFESSSECGFPICHPHAGYLWFNCCRGSFAHRRVPNGGSCFRFMKYEVGTYELRKRKRTVYLFCSKIVFQ